MGCLAQGHITGWRQNEDPTQVAGLLMQEYNNMEMLTTQGHTTCLLTNSPETLFIFMIHLRVAQVQTPPVP